MTATLSKALGAQGGAVLGSPALVEHLVNTARPFIFDTGLAPAAGGRRAGRPPGAARAAVAAVGRAPSDRRRWADALGVTELPAGAVLSVPMPSPAGRAGRPGRLPGRGLRVGCFRPPSVPDGVSRLRITANAGLTDADWAHAVDVLTRVVKEHQ